MADEKTSTVDESQPTPASSEPVEAPTTEQESSKSIPQMPDDVWDSIDKEEEGKPKETEPVKEPAPKEEPDEPKEEPKEPKEEPKDAKEGEKSPEDEVLEEVFKGDDPKTDEKTPEKVDLDKLDPQEMIDAQRNTNAKAWAKRNAEKAEVVKAFQYDTPINEVATKLEEINKQRYAELSQFTAHQLVDANPDATFRRAYAVKMLAKDPNWDVANAIYPTLDELIEAKAQAPAATASAPTAAPANLSELTAELDKELEWDWRNPELDTNFLDEREMALAKSLRAIEGVAQAEKTENSELKAKLDKLTKDVEGITTTAQSADKAAWDADLNTELMTYRSNVSNLLLPHLLRNAGLEPSANDTEKVAAFKTNRAKLFSAVGDNDSPFETFAYEGSSVKPQIDAVLNRIVQASAQAVSASRSQDNDAAKKFREEAEGERILLVELLGQAGKEFIEREIKPDMELIGELSSKLATPIRDQARRVEIVGNGSPGSQAVKRPVYQTADDVWASVVDDAAQEERLRAT